MVFLLKVINRWVLLAYLLFFLKSSHRPDWTPAQDACGSRVMTLTKAEQCQVSNHFSITLLCMTLIFVSIFCTCRLMVCFAITLSIQPPHWKKYIFLRIFVLFCCTNTKIFLNQDTFNWEANWHKILSLVFWKHISKLSEFMLKTKKSICQWV